MNKRQRIIQKYKGICQMCFKQTNTTNFKDYPELDHIIPRSMGGGNEEANLSLLCNACNNRRSNKSGEVLINSLVSTLENLSDFEVIRVLDYEVRSGTITPEMLADLKTRVNAAAESFGRRIDIISGEVKING